LLGEDLVTPVTVKADGRCAHQHARRPIQNRQRPRKQGSRAAATLEKNSFAGFIPAAVADTRASQMDCGVGTFEGAGIDSAGLWVPLEDVVIGSNRLAHDPYNFVPVREETGTQCSADQAARSRDYNPHASCRLEVMPDFK
jgi:hypothetical protein